MKKEPFVESHEPRLQKADTGLSNLCSYDRTQDSTHTVTQHSCREAGMWKDLDHLLRTVLSSENFVYVPRICSKYSKVVFLWNS